MSAPHYQAKRAVSMLAGPYGHPVHPILVTIPIGAWTTSLIFDIASRLVSHPGFLAQGSLWLTAIGVIGALAAACTGFLDLFAIPPATRAHRTALAHMNLNLAVTLAYVAGFAWRYRGHHFSRPVPAGQIALSAASLAALAVSGYLGGKLTYRYGVRVADELTQAQGYTDRPSPAASTFQALSLPGSIPAAQPETVT